MRLLVQPAPLEPSSARAIVAALAAGALAAAIGASLVLNRAGEPAAILFLAALYPAGVALTSVLVARWRLRRLPPPKGPLLAGIGAASAWLAPAAVLCGKGSPWSLGAAAVFGAAASSLFRGLAQPPEAEPPHVFLAPPQASPAAVRRSRCAKTAAAAAYAAAALVTAGHVLPAAALAAAAFAVLAWFATYPGLARPGVKTKIALAFAVTLAALLPALRFGYGHGSPGQTPQATDTGEDGPSAAPGGQYSGVVLLTEAKPESTALAQPPLRALGFSRPRPAQPVSIPFSGEYWYFYWPMRRPAENALRKLGDPKTLVYRSVDRFALIMQARQPLPKPIELACCGAVEVMLAVRDSEPETVQVELVLVHHAQTGQARQSLGVQPLPPPARAPAGVRFTVPRPAEIASFDEILVWFHLQEPRQGRSARLAIERFNLVP
jgi:hypothetical protein